MANKETTLNELRQEMSTIDVTLNVEQEVLLTTSQDLEKLEGRKEVLKERKKNASQNKAQLEKSIVEAEAALTRLEAEKKEQSNIVQLLEDEVKKLQSLLQEKQKSLGLLNTNLDETIEFHKGDYIEWLNKQATAKNEKQYLGQQLEQHDHKNTRLDQENAKYLTERTSIFDKKKQSEADLLRNCNRARDSCDELSNILETS